MRRVLDDGRFGESARRLATAIQAEIRENIAIRELELVANRSSASVVPHAAERIEPLDARI